jgi:hypothetical protein
LIYVVSGIALGTIGGWLLGKLNLEPLLSDWVKKILERKMQQGEYENGETYVLPTIA